eukprot:CAMPEP_0118884858 /NCGR_PEP_ID=MMETSP1163-20130328/23568_1 /TAXON_ID=124430 /ORGANISM="Phaeomonas parva, Strain CCMP2877" /LENGTH=705 /DNA_ID=CAMNT_0006822763 /DNA_START=29 /DNA_END=2146 /DNA_ORIENTATION=-
MSKRSNGDAGGDAKRARAAPVEFGPADEEAVNTIRVLSADMVQAANSGHPGAPMGCAPMAHMLWKEFMTYSPSNPNWFARDRFVLSNGHACALQYVMLHLTGYNVSMDDLKSFRQVGSITPGHPENFMTDGVEVCTGPLGQGISQAVGMAIVERHLASLFNRPDFDIVDNYTWVICGDGCLQEGVSGETGSLAGHLKLGKLIVLYDDNSITIDGDTDLSFTEDVKMRYESYGWQVIEVADVNDLPALHAAVAEAKACEDKPSMIKIKTKIGHGSALEGSAKAHGSPLGPDNVAAMKRKFGMDPEASFAVSAGVTSTYAAITARAEEAYNAWCGLFERYTAQYPDLAADYNRRMNGNLKDGWENLLPTFKPEDPAIATRKTSGACLAKLGTQMDELIGGSADLTPSNGTGDFQKHTGDFQASSPIGRYLRFGVREHGMSAIANGMAAYGGVRPFVATFLNFIGYALGAVRVSSLSRFPVLYIATHDSIFLGEDGPTHQPVEMLETCRCLPNMQVIRPADGKETSGAYIAALRSKTSPTVLALTRQNLPQLAGSSAEGVLRGAYVILAEADPSIVLVASGSEVSLCLDAAKDLKDNHGLRVRVVSMPCMSMFDAQSLGYKLSVFKEGPPILSVEASSPAGWAKYSHMQIGITRYGVSGKGGSVGEAFGFTVANVSANARRLIDHFGGAAAPCLAKLPGAVHTPVLGH